MRALVIAVAGAYGVHLLYSAVVLGWSGVGPGPRRPTRTRRPTVRSRVERWLAQAGLDGVGAAEFVAVVGAVAAVAAVVTFAVLGGVLPALAVGAFAATFPPATYRARRRTRLGRAHEAWPRLIDEIRVLTASAGRSVPQALFEAGGRAPAELRAPFRAAQRHWLLTTDFPSTVSTLKSLLADPTADAVCETLLVAHEVGGTEVDRRLADLSLDRAADVQTRKDVQARQAGARFARRFVLLVPAGMALAGLSIGTGRDAYRTAGGQVAVVVAIAMVVGCWVWAGRLMRAPLDERVFDR